METQGVVSVSEADMEKESQGYETVIVWIGAVTDSADSTRKYRFRGRELGVAETHRAARSQDDRGETYTLYEVEGGYRVHIKEWSRWQGERDIYYMASQDLHSQSRKGDVLSIQEVAERFPQLLNAAKIEYVEELE